VNGQTPLGPHIEQIIELMYEVMRNDPMIAMGAMSDHACDQKQTRNDIRAGILKQWMKHSQKEVPQ